MSVPVNEPGNAAESDDRPVRTFTDRHLIRITTDPDSPDGVEELLFDPGKIMLSETLAMEKAFDLTWPQIIAGLVVGRTPAIAAAIWVLRKRSNPKLRPSEVDFAMDALRVDDPDYEPAYGGVPEGEAYGDERPQDTVQAPPEDVAEGKDLPAPEATSSAPED